ncbi:MAG: ankyrin repeat domain-containing protein [archaeon]|nr:ankyrin repeat domain-containing protein [archaeon]
MLSSINLSQSSERERVFGTATQIQLFCSNPEEINTPNEFGWTPLYRALISNNKDALMELLSFGADPNIQTSMGETPLYQAIETENYELFEILIENKSNLNLPKNDGTTPLHLATKKSLTNFVEKLLLNGADPNLVNKLYKQTPLHIALKNTVDIEIVKLLHEYKVDYYAQDKYGEIAINCCEEGEYKEKVLSIFKDDLKEEPKKLTEPVEIIPKKSLEDLDTEGFKRRLESEENCHQININFQDINLESKMMDLKPKEKIEEIQNTPAGFIQDTNSPAISEKKSFEDKTPEPKNLFGEIIKNPKEFNSNTEISPITPINSGTNKDFSSVNMESSKEKGTESNKEEEFKSHEEFKVEESIKDIHELTKDEMKEEEEEIKEKEEEPKEDQNETDSNKDIKILSDRDNETKEDLPKEIKEDSYDPKKYLTSTFNLTTPQKEFKELLPNRGVSEKNLNMTDIHLDTLGTNPNLSLSKKYNYYSNKTGKDMISEINPMDIINPLLTATNGSNIFSELQSKSLISEKRSSEKKSINDLSKGNEQSLLNVDVIDIEDKDNEKNETENRITNTFNDSLEDNNMTYSKSKSYIVSDLNVPQSAEKNPSETINITADINKEIINSEKKNKFIKKENNEGLETPKMTLSLKKNNTEIKEEKKTQSKSNKGTPNTTIDRKYFNLEDKENNNILNIVDYSYPTEQKARSSNKKEEKITKKVNDTSGIEGDNTNLNLTNVSNSNNNMSSNSISGIYNKKNINQTHSFISNSINNTRCNTNCNTFTNDTYKGQNTSRVSANNTRPNTVLHIYPCNTTRDSSQLISKGNKEDLKNPGLKRIPIGLLNNSNNNSNLISGNNVDFSDISCSPINTNLGYDRMTKSNISDLSQGQVQRVFNNYKEGKVQKVKKISILNEYTDQKPMVIGDLDTSNFNTNANTNSHPQNLIQKEPEMIYSENEREEEEEPQNFRDIITVAQSKYLHSFLLSCGLLNYYNLLLNQGIYEIDKIIQGVANGELVLNQEDIKEIGIKKPGHILRFLLKIHSDAGLIDKRVVDYLLPNRSSGTYDLLKNSQVLLESSEYCCSYLCPTCNCQEIKRTNIDTDVNYWLRTNQLLGLKENFMHNGFDMLEFVLLQLFSEFTVDENFLTSELHIYDDILRKKLIKALYFEKMNISKAVGIKTDNYHYENQENKEADNCDCSIF